MTDDRKKVVFVLPALNAGGAERVMITLMNSLDRRAFEPVLVSVSDEGTLHNIIAPDIPCFILKKKGRVIRTLPLLFLQLAKLQPDVIVSTMAHMNFAVLLLKPFFPRTRFIVREAITPSFLLQDHGRIRLVLRLLYRTLYPRADMVISPAQIIIDEFNALPGMTVDNHRLLPNPVNARQIRGDESLPATTNATRQQTVHFIAAGRLHTQKGFDRLIEKLPSLHLPFEWKLTILGEGEERWALEELIRRHGLADRVSLPGLYERPWPAYAEADIFLLPSRYEGLPNVVLEALTCGTPVIATAESGGIDDIAREAAPNTVTVVQSMDEFIRAMEQVTPCPYPGFRPSLLPEGFYLESVTAEFAKILRGLTTRQKASS